MTLAKAVVSGTVFRAREKRYTQDDIGGYGLTVNIDDREETISKVFDFISQFLTTDFFN